MDHKKVQRLTGLALLTAVVAVLQLVATFVHIGPFSITLTLIPIVVGAAVYGPGAGAYLGLVFGVIVTLASIFGWDAGGAILWNISPLLTALVCLAKGALAGWAAGGVYRLAGKKWPTGGCVLAAVTSPVVNTGIFLLALCTLFYDTLLAWCEAWAAANSTAADITTYILAGLVGFNFLLELAINVILSPVIVRILRAKKQLH